MITITVLLLALIVMIPRRAGIPEETQDAGERLSESYAPAEEPIDTREVPGTAETTPEQTPETIPEPARGIIYLVIDDVGYNLGQLEQFLALPFPVTYAVLPQLDYTVSSYRRITDSGNEVILHQPFEPVGDQDPGPGALYVEMEPDRVRRTLVENLSQLPEAVGMNNHMGSKGTADERLLESVMIELKSRGKGFYFLDSRTTAETLVEKLAEKHRVLHSGRNVFLDNSPEPEDIREALEASLEIAEERGFVVMIGHVWSDELAEQLALWYEDVQRRGFVFAHLSSFFFEEAVHAGTGG